MYDNLMSAEIFFESDTIELKETWTEDAMCDIAAFANTRGGTLHIGVRDSGEVLGCDVSDDALQKIAGKIRNILQIGADIRVASYNTAAGQVRTLAISIKQSRSPVLLRGSYWTRMGTISVKAAPEQWAGLVLEQSGRTWDSLPARDDMGLETIDVIAVANYINKAKVHPKPRLPPEIADDTPPQIVLSTLGLYADETLTNAAVLLFGKTPHTAYRSARIRIARFRGDGVDDFSEHVPLIGTVLDQIDGAVRILEEYIPIRMLMPGTAGNLDEILRRRDLPEYPSSVLREAVSNSVIHRDYLSADDIQIRVFDDRFEIWNPGGLMPGLQIADLYKSSHDSKRRNPLIADAAFFVHVIERWGTGTSRMIETCAESGVAAPEFSERGGGFLTVLRKDRWHDEKLKALGFNERQLKVMPELRVKGVITAAIYQRITKASRMTALRDLKNMETAGVIQAANAGKSTHYVLQRPGSNR